MIVELQTEAAPTLAVFFRQPYRRPRHGAREPFFQQVG